MWWGRGGRKSTYTAARQKTNSNQAALGHKLIPVLKILIGYITVFNTNWSSLCTVKAHDPRPRVNLPNCTDEN